MNTMQKTFKLTALAAALMTVFGAALADDAEVAELIKPDSSVSVGVGNWSNDRHQQGIYDGMRDKGAYGLLDADINKRDDATGTWLKLKASNLGLDDREIKGEYLRQGDIGVSLEYNRISRDNPNTFTTRLQGIGTTNLTPSTAALASPLREVKLGTDRDQVNVGFFKNLMPGLDFNLSFKNEDKKGTRQWGRGQQPEFAVEPIDSTIRQLEGTLSYSTKALQLSGGYYGSWYDNKNSLVTIRNAGLAATNANTTYLSLPLDNQAHQFFLNGGYAFTPSTRGTFKVAYTHATQNDHLPTQDIPGLSLAGSPTSLNGELNTTLVQLGLTSRPIKDLSLVANLRYYDMHDDTPVRRFVQQTPGSDAVACTASNSAHTCVDNTPLSYKTITGKLEGTYRLPDGYSVTAGVEERRQDRNIPVSNTLGAGGTDNQRVVPFRTTVDETTWRLEGRRALSDVLNGSLAYLNSRRTGSSYQFAAGPGNSSSQGFTNISNQINPLNVANRDRNKVRLALDWTPIENLSFQFNIEEARDNYDHDSARPFGLEEGTARLYGLDATYTLNDKWKVNAWYSYDHSQAKQKDPRAADSGGNTAIKDYDLQDTGNSVGLGLRGEVSSRVKLGADLQWSRNLSKYLQTVTALNGTPGTSTVATFTPGLPDIENTLIKLSFFSTYALDKNSDVRVDFIHERWKTNDWSWMFANGTPFAYTGGNVGSVALDGTTVTANQTQTSNFIGARYIYKFQ